MQSGQWRWYLFPGARRGNSKIFLADGLSITVLHWSVGLVVGSFRCFSPPVVGLEHVPVPLVRQANGAKIPLENRPKLNFKLQLPTIRRGIDDPTNTPVTDLHRVCLRRRRSDSRRKALPCLRHLCRNTVTPGQVNPPRVAHRDHVQTDTSVVSQVP